MKMRPDKAAASAFKYSVRPPFAASPVAPELLGQKLLTTLDALTKIDPDIFPDWDIGELPAMKGRLSIVGEPCQHR